MYLLAQIKGRVVIPPPQKWWENGDLLGGGLVRSGLQDVGLRRRCNGRCGLSGTGPFYPPFEHLVAIEMGICYESRKYAII